MDRLTGNPRLKKRITVYDCFFVRYTGLQSTDNLLHERQGYASGDFIDRSVFHVIGGGGTENFGVFEADSTDR